MRPLPRCLWMRLRPLPHYDLPRCWPRLLLCASAVAAAGAAARCRVVWLRPLPAGAHVAAADSGRQARNYSKSCTTTTARSGSGYLAAATAGSAAPASSLPHDSPASRSSSEARKLDYISLQSVSRLSTVCSHFSPRGGAGKHGINNAYSRFRILYSRLYLILFLVRGNREYTCCRRIISNIFASFKHLLGFPGTGMPCDQRHER